MLGARHEVGPASDAERHEVRRDARSRVSSWPGHQPADSPRATRRLSQSVMPSICGGVLTSPHGTALSSRGGHAMAAARIRMESTGRATVVNNVSTFRIATVMPYPCADSLPSCKIHASPVGQTGVSCCSCASLGPGFELIVAVAIMDSLKLADGCAAPLCSARLGPEPSMDYPDGWRLELFAGAERYICRREIQVAACWLCRGETRRTCEAGGGDLLLTRCRCCGKDTLIDRWRQVKHGGDAAEKLLRRARCAHPV